MQLNKAALGLALAIVWGVSVVLTTLWVSYVGGDELLDFLGKFYPGYSVSFFGAVVGFVYGFIDGFIYGFFIAWLYNAFAARLTSS